MEKVIFTSSQENKNLSNSPRIVNIEEIIRNEEQSFKSFRSFKDVNVREYIILTYRKAENELKQAQAVVAAKQAELDAVRQELDMITEGIYSRKIKTAAYAPAPGVFVMDNDPVHDEWMDCLYSAE